VNTELQAVNECLASMGEAPVLSLSVPHPYVPYAVQLLAKHNKLVQTNRWWFNTTILELVPVAPTYTVAASLPAGVTGIIGIDDEAYVLNGDGTVYDIAAGEQVTTPITVYVTRELAFESLPPQANAYITACAVLDFQRKFDGDTTRANQLREDRTTTYLDLNAMHIRLSKVNLLRRTSTAGRFRRIRGDRPVIS
jgi:hypothetical protein